MTQSTTRVLAVLELLQSHGRLSGAEMGRRLGVDGRTLRRYIVTLEELGIPVVAERGPHGGYALMAGFKLPPMMFSDDETLALAIGLLAVRRLGLAATDAAIASAQAKLERVMPAGLRHRMRVFGESVELDLGHSVNIDAASLHMLATAATARRSVRLSYRSGQGADTQRRLDPYGVAFHAGCWYAVGMCGLRKAIRTFRLDRIVAIDTLDAVFARPDNFDILAHLRESVATLPRAFAVRVLLKTELMSARACLDDAIGVLEQTEDGVVLHNQSDDLAWLARQLAAMPFAFVIRAPEQLRSEVRKLGRRLQKA